jgi:hypothetical protein
MMKKGIIRTNTSGSSSLKMCVDFAIEVTIYEFPLQIGDNPAVSAGCPITIGWKPIRKDVRCLEVYEFQKRVERKKKNRPEHTASRVKRIPSDKRGQLLLQAGYTIHDIAAATLSADRVKEQRMDTLRKHGWDRFATILDQTGKLPSGIMKATLGTTGDILSTTGDLVLATGGLLVNTTMTGLGSAGRQLSKTFGNTKPKTMPARSA